MNTSTKEYQDFLSLKPCNSAIYFVQGFDNLHTAWENCKEPLWLWWYVTSVSRATTLMGQQLFEWMKTWSKENINLYSSVCIYALAFHRSTANIGDKNWAVSMAMVHVTNYSPEIAACLCDFIRSNIIPNPFQKHEH